MLVDVFPSTTYRDIFVDSRNGDDVGGDGSFANPFRDLPKAISALEFNSGTCTVHLAPGAYGSGAQTLEIPASTTLQGNTPSKSATTIECRVELGTDCRASNVWFRQHLRLQGAGAVLENVMTSAVGLEISTQGDVELRNSHVYAIHATVLGSLFVSSCELKAHSTFTDCQRLTLRSNTIRENCSLEIRGTAEHTILDSNNSSGTIALYQSGLSEIFSNSFIGSADSALWIQAGTLWPPEGFKIHNNEFRLNKYGITISGTDLVDLGGGPLGSLGDNIIRDNTDHNLRVLGPKTGSGTVYAKSNQWDDPQPAGKKDAPATTLNYDIKGNSVQF